MMNVVTGVLLARELGPEGRGELAAIILWPTVLAFTGDLGTADATTYHTARKTAPTGAVLGTTLVLSVILSVGLVAVALSIIPLVLSQQRDAVVAAAQIFTVFIPVNILHLNLLGMLNGRRDFVWFHMMRFLAYVLVAVMLVALSLTDNMGIEPASWTYVLANLIVVAIVISRLLYLGIHEFQFDSVLLKQILSFGVRSWSSSAATVMNERADQLAMAAVLPPRQLGLYVVAATFTAATVAVGHAVSLVMLPVIAGIRERIDQARETARLSALAFSLSAFVSVAIAAVAPQLVETFFGERFLPSTTPARLLLAAAVFLSTNRVLAAALKGINHPLAAGGAELLALGVMAIALVVLLPPFGIVGAAVASILAYAVSFAAMSVRLRQVIGLPLRALVVPDRNSLRDLRARAATLLSTIRGLGARER